MFVKWPYARPRRGFALLGLLALATLGIAGDTNVQNVSFGGGFYAVYPGGTSAPLVVKSSPGRLYRIINANATAQTATLTCYDNATAAAGQVLYAVVLAASAVADVQIPTAAGLTCSASAATLAGNPILILAN